MYLVPVPLCTQFQRQPVRLINLAHLIIRDTEPSVHVGMCVCILVYVEHN